MSRCVFLAVVFALTRFASAADLLLLDKSNAIRRYDENGNFVGTNGSVYDPGGFDRAPDGTLYVGSFGLAQLNKLDASGEQPAEGQHVSPATEGAAGAGWKSLCRGNGSFYSARESGNPG